MSARRDQRLGAGGCSSSAFGRPARYRSASTRFPAEHWSTLRSTNPLERFNREIGRRTDVVGIFPDDASLIRLVSMLAIEANDEWLVGRAYISQKSMSTLWHRGPEKEPHIENDKEVELIAA